jgi:hypothetical protein
MVRPVIKNLPNAQVQATGSNSTFPETGLNLPWLIDPVNSWIDYSCWIEVTLDSGIALHKPLPQQPFPVDTLAQVDCQYPQLDQVTPGQAGVNIASRSKALDIFQRMATSTYRFILRGYAMRAGYQIPIPGIFKIAGQEPVPMLPQRATNFIVANYNGIPIWQAVWELHYNVEFSPQAVSNPVVPVPFNPALHIRPDAELPDDMPAMVSLPDQAHTEGALGGEVYSTPGPGITLTGQSDTGG